MLEPLNADVPDRLVTILDHIRHKTATTRPELERATGLTRKMVAQRVEYLMGLGLLENGPLGSSTGGRVPRQIVLRKDAGTLLVAELNTSAIAVALTDLDGNFLARASESAAVHADPDVALSLIEDLFDQLLALDLDRAPVWGICVGVILPVSLVDGRPVQMPFLPAWGGYPVAERLSTRFGVRAWVENEVNLMALGQLRAPAGPQQEDFVFVKIGGGIGAGIVAGGNLIHGAQGGAGEIGHITVVDDPDAKCWCGNSGCLMQMASGIAISRLGTELAEQGASDYLSRILADGREIDPRDVVEAAGSGDRAALDVVVRAGELVGKALAGLVNIFNPDAIFIGGNLMTGSDVMLAAVRRTVYERALPMSTRQLSIEFAPFSDDAGLLGAAHKVLDELFSEETLSQWIQQGSPAAEPRKALAASTER